MVSLKDVCSRGNVGESKPEDESRGCDWKKTNIDGKM